MTADNRVVYPVYKALYAASVANAHSTIRARAYVASVSESTESLVPRLVVTQCIGYRVAQKTGPSYLVANILKTP